LRARVVESSPEGVREAWVLHDGQDVWHIVAGETTELSHRGSATFINAARFETVRGMGVASNNWVKSMIQGRLIGYLTESTGHVVDSEMVEGRSCWVAKVRGLKANQAEAAFRLWVDAETGIIVRLERTDLNGVVRVESIELGVIIEGTSSADLIDE
jgi:hypothetical protein